jgi:hypothetical protein
VALCSVYEPPLPGIHFCFKTPEYLNPHYVRPYVVTCVSVVAGILWRIRFSATSSISCRQILALPIKEGKIQPREGHEGP